MKELRDIADAVCDSARLVDDEALKPSAGSLPAFLAQFLVWLTTPLWFGKIVLAYSSSLGGAIAVIVFMACVCLLACARLISLRRSVRKGCCARPSHSHEVTPSTPNPNGVVA